MDMTDTSPKKRPNCEQTVDPFQPVDPVQPADSAQPDHPADPAQPNQPAQPAYSAHPVDPVPLANPAQPAQPAVQPAQLVIGDLVVSREQAAQSQILADLFDQPISVDAFRKDLVSSFRWLTMWFAGKTVIDFGQQFGMHGLNELLPGANFFGLDGCVDQIVTASIVLAGVVQDVTQDVTLDQLERCYFQLSSQWQFPPVGIEWKSVDKLCMICIKMPNILALSLDQVWTRRLLGQIDNLYLLDGKRLSTTTVDADVGYTIPDYVVRLAGKPLCRYSFGGLDNTCYLVKLSAEQGWFDCFDVQNYNCVDSQPGLPTAMDVSPGGRYLLWKASCYRVFDTHSQANVEMRPGFAEATKMWWIDDTALAVCAKACRTFVVVEVQDLNNRDMIFDSFVGESASRSKTALVCAAKIYGHTLVTHRLRSGETQTFWCDRLFDFVCPHMGFQSCGSVFVVKTASNELCAFGIQQGRHGMRYMKDAERTAATAMLVWQR